MIDLASMYPSIKYSLMKKYLQYFMHTLLAVDKEKVGTCLEMINFGMSLMLLTFQDRYYSLHGGDKDGEKGLDIGG